jgi:Ser/Thr protein kinase RdoA (MazF antagonist)
MGLIIDLVPWVLTHQDLSGMNILVDPDTGHITGVVDWADATLEPFSMVLWGLDGCRFDKA